MDLSHCADEDTTLLDEDQRVSLELAGQAVLSYIKTAAELLEGKYSHVRHLAPVHLRNPGKVLVVFCGGGIAVRFESKSDQPEVIVAWSAETFGEMVSKLSQDVIHCHLDHVPQGTPAGGMALTIF